ncbi:uncharacterized protein LOC8058633 [Sorghum bicolor]|uniref:DUF7054 domain-containing protein n=1 Tax=Sorghum bicolor TaxID=4558 RepID=C5XTC8_SORBI|nr:uncharacterized protein LOC8058633 [Sorghum bicolor]EES06897.1 hypothetical protein SORBI_3004G163100 [Sorghum bicolor]OQU85044.1 hypothetical protein SORBI_3004G163100 [Sorghum bicolor]|eukprot:XP_002453921.1 uncharacterized protein LOC8058633 [Sorghum bicolor]
MPPSLAPPPPPAADHKAWPRQQRHAEKKKKAAGSPAPRRASFHGRGTSEQEEQQRQQRDHHLLRQRPRTHPDLLLLAGVRERGFRRAGVVHATTTTTDAAVPWGSIRAAPSKALVTVAVQRSMWPLHVMAGAEWRVADLVAAAVGLYVREGRRPLLPSADPSAFGLHYSQFSLESLDPEEKLMELEGRSFFLCPRATAAPSTRPATEASKATPTSADRQNMLPPWLSFMHFWPLL